VALALALSACGGEDPNAVPPPEPAPFAEELRIARVDRLEFGRAARGFVLAAYGVTDTAGWREPRLDPVADGPGPDGFLVYDFVALAPLDPVVTPEPARILRADVVISPEALRSAAGVRVRAASGSVETRFE
jgi:hypothetical protein